MRKRYTQKMRSYSEDNIKEAIDAINRSDDRSCVLLVSAFLEQYLAVAIEGLFIPNLSNEFLDRTFDGYGPLSSFSARIDLAFALGVIPRASRDELLRVKQIRNHFAHELAEVTFQSPEIVAECRKLTFSTPAIREAVKKRCQYESEARIQLMQSFLLIIGSAENPTNVRLEALQRESPSLPHRLHLNHGYKRPKYRFRL